MEDRASTGVLADLTMHSMGVAPREYQPMQASKTEEGGRKTREFPPRRVNRGRAAARLRRGYGQGLPLSRTGEHSNPEFAAEFGVSSTTSAAMSIGSYAGVGACVRVASHQGELSHSGGGVGRDRYRGKGLFLGIIRAWRRVQRKGGTVGDEPSGDKGGCGRSLARAARSLHKNIGAV